MNKNFWIFAISLLAVSIGSIGCSSNPGVQEEVLLTTVESGNHSPAETGIVSLPPSEATEKLIEEGEFKITGSADFYRADLPPEPHHFEPVSAIRVDHEASTGSTTTLEAESIDMLHGSIDS